MNRLPIGTMIEILGWDYTGDNRSFIVTEYKENNGVPGQNWEPRQIPSVVLYDFQNMKYILKHEEPFHKWIKEGSVVVIHTPE